MLALLLTAVHLVLPGAAVALAARVRPLLAVLTAPAVSFGLIALASRVTSATGLAWAPLSFWLLVLLFAGVVAGLRWLSRRLPAVRRLPWGGPREDVEGTRRERIVLLVAATAAALVGTGVAVWGMGGLAAINQGFDALFHVNAVTLISQTHDADPAAMGAVNHYDYGATYYPDAFHALAALVADLGVPPVVATNALVAAVPAVLALGFTALLWQLGLPRHAVVVPFVAVSIAAFPTDLMWRGPIWPFALGLALVPAMLALLVGAFERASRATAVLAALAAAGLLLVHPSAALAAAVFAAAYFVQRWLTDRSTFRGDILPLGGTALIAVIVALPAVMTALASSGYGVTYDWAAVQTPGQAIGDLLLFNYEAPLPQLWLAVTFVIGLCALRSLRRAAWFLSAAAVFAVLLVLAAAYEGPVVALLTGPWWNDRFRFAGIATLGLAVVCGHGLVVLAQGLVALSRRLPRVRTVLRPGLALAVIIALFGAVSAGFYAGHNRDRMQQQYSLGSGESVTADDLDAMRHLAGMVAPGEVVMNDPGDGSAWMWALHGIRPMFGQAVLSPVRPALQPDQQRVLAHFDCIDSSPAVRRVVERYDIHHVFVSDSFVISNMHRIAGLQALDGSRSVKLVYRNGGAAIYEVRLQPLVSRSQDAACGKAQAQD